MTSEMKVCFVTPYTPKEISGVGEVILTLGGGLRERNQDYMILTKSSSESERRIPGLAEVKYRNIKLIGGLLLIIGALYTILRERKSIDVIHLHSISWLTAISAIWGLVLGIPCVLTLHGKHPMPSGIVSIALFKVREKLVIAASGTMTCVSSETKRFYDLESAVVIRNGIDTMRFQPDPEARQKKRTELGLGDSFTLLFLGRLDPLKGIYELLDIAGRLVQKNDLKLIIVGSGEDEKVRISIRENSLESFVRQVGGVDDAVPYYQCSDLYVLFSSLEGIPLTLLEAMSCELPSIATTVGGIGEVIENGKDGFLIAPGDVDALETKIVWCLSNGEELRKMSENSRKRIIGAFNQTDMIERYISIYRSVVKS